MQAFFSQFTKNFDVYKMSLHISLKGTNTSKTFCGGILSFIMIFIFFILLIYLFTDLSNKQNQYYTQSNLRYPKPPNFNFTSSLYQHRNEDIPFFFFALSFFTDKGDTITFEEVNNYFYIEAQSQIYVRKNSTSAVENNYYLVSCEKNLKDSVQYFDLVHNSSNSSAKKKTYYCLNENKFNVEGDFINSIYKFVSIKLKDCKNNPNKNITCNTDKTKFSNFINSFNIDIIYSYHYIKSEIVSDIPLEYFIKRNTIKVSERLYQKIDYYLNYSWMFSEENLFFKFFGSLNKKFITTPKIILNYASVSSTYMGLYMRSNYDYVYITRSYKTFLNLISQLGGIWKFLIIIGISIISKFNLKSMLNILGNSIYSIISPSVKKNADKYENLNTYKTKGNDAFPNNILVSNNKSDIEAELYIDIYKYERNRGLHIKMKDMIFQTYFTCLLDEEKKKIMKLQQKVENGILMKLDFIKVLMFIKQFKIFKAIILHKKNSLIRLNEKNRIEYKYKQLLKLSKSIQEKKADMDVNLENNEEKRIIREEIFIKGLRYFRNKPVFDKNIDVKIFNRFRWNRQIMSRYLIKNIEIKDNNKN